MRPDHLEFSRTHVVVLQEQRLELSQLLRYFKAAYLESKLAKQTCFSCFSLLTFECNLECFLTNFLFLYLTYGRMLSSDVRDNRSTKADKGEPLVLLSLLTYLYIPLSLERDLDIDCRLKVDGF